MLPDIDTADVGIITADDQACLDEVGSCLLGAKVHSRFGLTLLHSHFPVYDDEMLLEEVNADERVITVRPVRADLSSVFATNVYYDDAGQLVGLEFASYQTLAGVEPISDLDSNVLIGIVEILQRCAKTKRFGIRLLHDPLGLDGSVLLETSDLARRILSSRGETDNPALLQSIPTVFRWEEVRAGSGDGLTIDQGCMQYCRTVSRCVQPVRGSHDRSRSHEPTGHENV
ncbi:hypothetical protein [Bradyrhizobium manausense]|uniref:hypothetical protein n=1 Tax=Bradyrhizobium manausense TaxID=989370 RepID=UPI001BA95474|nr:hypothetical protein [Bradyrhizobium manausense]MBR0726780.1 hypothetical protein [Bradyrhizobium manausense]